MNKKLIGKIQSIEFGFGGYQEAQIGISVTLGGDKEGWGVGDFRGPWARNPDKHCKWTKEEQIQQAGETVMWLRDLLLDAKVNNINELSGIPVEVEFEGNTLKSWRILTEVI